MRKPNRTKQPASCGLFSRAEMFSHAELDFLLAVLRYCHVEFLELAKSHERMHPRAAIVDTYRQWAAQAYDLCERIEHADD